MPDDYKMPPVNVGDIVIQRFGSNSRVACPMVVTQVGERTISGTIFSTEFNGGRTIRGVRHSSDPQRTPQQSGGMWDFKDDDLVETVTNQRADRPIAAQPQPKPAVKPAPKPALAGSTS
jgi:hypothetical protein